MKFTDFYEAYYWLYDHPYYINHEEPCDGSVFLKTLDMQVVKVNPSTEYIEDDSINNTATRVWLESGELVYDENHGWMLSHDWDLDCGADTFENAILELANLVYSEKGDYVINDEGEYETL